SSKYVGGAPDQARRSVRRERARVGRAPARNLARVIAASLLTSSRPGCHVFLQDRPSAINSRFVPLIALPVREQRRNKTDNSNQPFICATHLNVEALITFS